jgi:hypothetical protein
MDVDSDVALVRDRPLAGVQSHPNADRRALERILRIGRRRDGLASRSERDEKRIALGIDFDTTVCVERLAQNATMLREGLGESLRAELLQQVSRPFDVGEQQGDGPRPNGLHSAMIAPVTPT